MIQQNLTTGNITSKLWKFALPLMAGNVMQQFYNLVDTWVVGKFIGPDALAAVGTSYSFMTFVTSIIIGLCLGCSAFFSIAIGQKDYDKIRNGFFMSFCLTGFLSIVISGAAIGLLPIVLNLLKVPLNIQGDMYTYLFYILCGLCGSFLFNYFANFMRGIGNSVVPLVFLGSSVVLNTALDVLFVVKFGLGIKGAAVATTLSQYMAGIGLMICFYILYPDLRIKKQNLVWKREAVIEIASLSGFTCLQQSVMNLGILLVQGIVNGFGITVMAAFTVAVKIDTIAYMPVQDFGNAFSIFVAQNYGAEQMDRIKEGIRKSLFSIMIFCVCISFIVILWANSFMRIFIDMTEYEIISIGVRYLRIEGACYIGIGILFMLYGFYRAVKRPQISVILTVISLGTRVILAAVLSKIPTVGIDGIWLAIPIGWFLADLYGFVGMKRIEKGILNEKTK